MISSDEKKLVRTQCQKFLIGHKLGTAAEELARVAAWCGEHAKERDVYGEGDLITSFESKVAKLLGKDAAVFMPSGTMAQQIALRIHTDTAKGPSIGLHATSHLELHEQRAYAYLHNLNATLVGERHRAILARDIEACATPLAALVVELPQREIGGVLPTWAELEDLKRICAEKNVKLHMDGARLWEAHAHFAPKSHAEIAAGFASIYVSCYKGLGGLGGAVLAGDKDFIAESRVWLRRHGGNLVQMHPYVAAAAMNFDERLAQMPAYLRHAQRLARAAQAAGAEISPAPPQTNMFHLYLRGTPERLDAAHLEHAKKTGLWLTGRFNPAQVPGWSWFEVYVGDNALAIEDADLSAALRALS